MGLDHRSRSLSFRLNGRELRLLREAVAARGTTLSEFCRQAVIQAALASK